MAQTFRHRHHPRMGSRGQPEESRAAILRAAALEFAENGIAGARTDAIAREARVNKALLYYYFKDKETLKGWTGPLIQQGASASAGNVYEPYLIFTTDFGTLEEKLRYGS